MSYRYTGLEANDGVALIGSTSNGDDHEVFCRVEDVRIIEVDWLTESGRITVITTHRSYEVTFDDNDGGQQCADAISDLHRAMRKEVPVGSSTDN